MYLSLSVLRLKFINIEIVMKIRGYSNFDFDLTKSNWIINCAQNIVIKSGKVWWLREWCGVLGVVVLALHAFAWPFYPWNDDNWTWINFQAHWFVIPIPASIECWKFSIESKLIKLCCKLQKPLFTVLKIIDFLFIASNTANTESYRRRRLLLICLDSWALWWAA